jgi:hypothetical protein
LAYCKPDFFAPISLFSKTIKKHMDCVQAAFCVGWKSTKDGAKKAYDKATSPEFVDGVKDFGTNVAVKTKHAAIWAKDGIAENVVIPVKDKLSDEEFRAGVKDNVYKAGEWAWDGAKWVAHKTWDVGVGTKDAIKEGNLLETSKDGAMSLYSKTVEAGCSIKDNMKENCLGVPTPSQRPILEGPEPDLLGTETGRVTFLCGPDSKWYM